MDALNILKDYYLIANDLKININKNKSYIKKINEPFIYCKWKYKLYCNGKILVIPIKKTLSRQKNKLKKMYKNNVCDEYIKEVKNSFIAYLSLGNINLYNKTII